MSADSRIRTQNKTWSVNVLEGGSLSPSDAQLAVLMDIRQEIKDLKANLGYKLDIIAKNTKKPRKYKKRKTT